MFLDLRILDWLFLRSEVCWKLSDHTVSFIGFTDLRSFRFPWESLVFVWELELVIEKSLFDFTDQILISVSSSFHYIQTFLQILHQFVIDLFLFQILSSYLLQTLARNAWLSAETVLINIVLEKSMSHIE